MAWPGSGALWVLAGARWLVAPPALTPVVIGVVACGPGREVCGLMASSRAEVVLAAGVVAAAAAGMADGGQLFASVPGQGADGLVPAELARVLGCSRG